MESFVLCYCVMDVAVAGKMMRGAFVLVVVGNRLAAHCGITDCDRWCLVQDIDLS